MLSIAIATLVQLAQVTQVASAHEQVAKAAAGLMVGLSDTEHALACAAFTDPRRTQWNYLPGPRFGVRLDQLDEGSAADLTALLSTLHSARGLAKVCGIHDLEAFLGRARPGSYSRGAYTLAMFGDPSVAGAAWGFRYEGHHLSLNYTAPAGGSPEPAGGSPAPTGAADAHRHEIAVTPMFLGTAPFAVPDGKTAGERPLLEERDRAFELLRSLTPEEKSRAILSESTPPDVTAGPPAKSFDAPRGITYASLNPAQQAKMLALIGVYATRLRGELADAELARAKEAGLDAIHFAWMGSDTAERPHYYRIQGPTLLIEFDCTSGTVDHAHTVWRDPTRDFGVDPLAEHRRDNHAATPGTGAKP